MPINFKNPFTKTKLDEMSKREILTYIEPEVKKRLEGLDLFTSEVNRIVNLKVNEIKKSLTPEIKEIMVDKIINKKNPINKALMVGVIVLSLAVAFLIGKNLFAASFDPSKIFNVTNYYAVQDDANLGAGIVNPGVTYLRNLRDVRVSGVSAGELLGYSSSGTWEATSTGAGAGDVVGPSVSIGDNFAFFDGVTGKAIKDSGYAFSDLVPSSTIGTLTNTKYCTSDGTKINCTATPAAGIALTDLSNTATGLTYNNTTGVTSLTAGYVIPVSLPSQNLYIGNSLNATEATSSISSSLVAVSSLSGANDDLTNLIDSVFSPGKISGGVITDNGDDSISVGAGLGMARTTDNATTTMRFIAWAEDTSVSLTDDTLNYIVVAYNLGTPSVSAVTTLAAINNTTQFPIGVVFRDGNNAEILEDGIFLPNYRAKSWHRLAHRGVEKMSGGSVSASSTLGFGMTSSILFYSDTEVLNPAAHVDYNTAAKVFYRDGGIGWTESTTHKIYPDLYDDNDGTPGTIGNNKYSVYFVYQCLEGNIYILMGQGDYTLTQAQDAQLPATLPNYLSQFAYPYGKIISLKGATSFTEIENNVSQNFALSGATNHNDLGGIQGGAANDYYHLLTKQVSELTALEVGSSSKLSTSLAQNLIFRGNDAGLAEATTSPYIGLTNLSCTATGLTYTNTTGAFSWTAGYEGLLSASKTKWDNWYNASTSKISTSLTANSYLIGNAAGVAEATTTINLLTKAFAVASSTYFFSTGSSTIPLGYQFYQDTWSSIACKFIGGASPTGHIVCGDGTNNMNTLNITGTMASTTLSTNNVLQVKDQAQCVLEAVANSPDILTCNITYRRN